MFGELMEWPRMDTDAHGSDLTEAVIGSAFEIANVLGAGFLEKVYERPCQLSDGRWMLSITRTGICAFAGTSRRPSCSSAVASDGLS